MHDWSGINLDQDAWVLFNPDKKLVGYGAVYKRNADFAFDFYTHPADEGEKLRVYLLTKCEARASAQLTDIQDPPGGTITTIISQVNGVARQILEEAGFNPQKYFFRMLIDIDTLPLSPVWTEDCTLRTMVLKQDDQMVYDFIQVAFELPGRTPPSFEGWRDYMMRPDHFESDLWFLLFTNRN